MIAIDGGVATITSAVIVAGLGYLGVQANRNAKTAVKTANNASDISFPLQALKETIAELRTEINRLQVIIEGLNKTIDNDQKKYAEIVKERDALEREKERLQNKVAKLEREKKRLQNAQTAQ